MLLSLTITGLIVSGRGVENVESSNIYRMLSLFLSGCTSNDQQSIINHHADALLTKTNELQFRFQLNDKVLLEEEAYVIKVNIHNKELALALGADEIFYGNENGQAVEVIEPEGNKDFFIYMEPIPLQKDLHVFDIENMIENQAVSIEIINNEHSVAKGYLTHFSSQL